MKKWLWLFILLIAAPVFAGNSVKKVINTTVVTSPSVVSAACKTADADRIAFFATYREVETSASVSTVISVQVSADGVNYTNASFYDYAGGSTLQTSETISVDGNYTLWMNRDQAVPYTKFIFTTSNADANNTAAITGTVVTQQ